MRLSLCPRYILLAVSCALWCQPVIAQDNVLSTIEEAVKQYRVGDYAGAASNLDYAAQLVRQKKSEKMKDLLPNALPGWQAGEASAQAVGAAVLGGGVTVSRDYTKGQGSVSIEIVADSPVLQSVLMMINNPMFAGAGGGKLETVKRQRAVVKYDNSKKSGDIYVVIGGRFLVTIKGDNVEREAMVEFAKAIDYQALERS